MANSATSVLPAPVGAETITDWPAADRADGLDLEVVERERITRAETLEKLHLVDTVARGYST